MASNVVELRNEKGSPMLERIDDPGLLERVVNAQKWLGEKYSEYGTWPKVRAYMRTSFSDSALSGYSNGTYPGNAENLTAEIERVRADTEEATRGFRTAYTETTIARRIVRAVTLTKARGELGLLSTESGVGKSTALKHLLSSERKAKEYSYFRANATMKRCSAWAALDGLYSSVVRGQANPARPIANPAACYNNLRELLASTRRTIIVDEAQHLSSEALDAFRDVAEEADTPFLFAGNPQVYEFGFLDRSNPSAFAQFATRCLVQEHIRCRDIGKHDVELIASQLLTPEVLREQTDAKAGKAITLLEDLTRATQGRGGFRRLKGILQRSQERAGGKPPDAAQVLRSIDDVAKLWGDV